MRMAIDSRTLTLRPSGTSSYLTCAINEMSRQNPSWIFYLLVHKDLHPETIKLLGKRKNIIIIKKPFFLFPKVGAIWHITKIYFILKTLKPDIFWAPGDPLPLWIPKKIRTIMTVHDFVPKKFKHTMAFNTRLVNNIFFDQSIKKADILWAVSTYTEFEIRKYYPDRKRKNIFVGSGVNKSIFQKKNISLDEKHRLLAKLKINEKFLLFVGAQEPRKNLKFLLSLMPEISKLGYSLLIVGSKGWGKTDIAKVLNQEGYPRNKVVFSGFLSTEELVNVFNIASIYVSSSLNEGFGLPQLEAMNCGCPVVSSHNSGMIEVVEGAGETVKGWDKEDWLNAIRHVDLNRDHYIHRGFKRAQEYDWTLVIRNLTRHLETG